MPIPGIWLMSVLRRSLTESWKKLSITKEMLYMPLVSEKMMYEKY